MKIKMKNNLSLIQPLEYNNLYSSYHNNSTKYRYTNYKLPKITKLFPSQEHKELKEKNITFFNKNNKIIKRNNIDKIIENKRQKKLIYPSFNESQSNDISNHIINRGIKPITMYHTYKINQGKFISIKNKEKLNNSHKLNMIYLNLFKSPLEKKIKNFVNLDSFYNFEIKDNNNGNDEILSKKFKEINNYSIIKIKNIFNETDFGKINEDLLNLNNNISKAIIDKFIEKIFNKKRINNKKDDNNTNDISNIKGESSILITNNVFLDWILDNVRHKIELKNEFNQHLSTVWVQNLINSEINELKNRFSEFRNSIKFSNFLEFMNSKNKFNLSNKKTLKKNDKSNFTSTTFRSYFDNSYIKSYLNNSNLNSNYNNENNQVSKNSQNTTINNIIMSFDFYDNNNSKKLVNYNDKPIIKINEPNTTNKNLIKKLKYNPYKKTLFNKNKTEVNNNYEKKEDLWFKNVFLNNPRSNKIKNFKTPNSIEIESKLKYINNNEKPNNNNDILEKIIRDKEKDKDKNEKYNYNPKNNDYLYSKRRNSFNFSNNEDNNTILKLKLKEIDDNKNNVTPSKELISSKDDDLKIKPKFKNVILMGVEKLYKKRNKKKFDEDNNNNKENNEKKINKEEKKSKRSFKFSSNYVKVDDNKNKSKKRRNAYTSPKIKKIKNKRDNKKKIDNNNLILNSSSNSSSSISNEEDEKDTFEDIENEKIKEIKRNLVAKRHKTEKLKLSLFQINKLKKWVNRNPNYNKNNNDDENNNLNLHSNSNSLLSISSVDEQEDLNENIKIKNEIDLLNNKLSNNEIFNLFNLIMELKKDLKEKNKTEEIKKEIKNKKIEIKNIIQIYFENLLSSLSIKEIKEDQKHLEIFEKLEILKKYCSFSSKELNDLEDKILDERNEEVEEYVLGFKNQEEKKEKKNRKFSSIEPILTRKTIKKAKSINDNNFIFEFKRGKRKKTNLIYNNLYLFKDNESDDDNNKSNLLIKKEIQDILNTDYGNIPLKINDTTVLISRRRRKENTNTKRNYVKRKNNRVLLKINDELLNEEILLKNKRLNEELEEEMKREKMRDKKIYEFFEKIQRLKKSMTTNNDDELNSFIDKQIEQNNEIPKEKNGGRLNIFLQEFLSNRMRSKLEFNIKNKRIGFLSPIIFTSPNETYNFNKNVNYIKKC